MRCRYIYTDGVRCIMDGAFKNRRRMCEEHNLMTQMKEDKAKNDAKRDRPITLAEGRPSRAKPKVEPTLEVKQKPRYEEVVSYDHTAPWKCGLKGCDICKDKPTYNEYMKGK